MVYLSDLTDEQSALLEPVFNVPGKRGRKHADDLCTVVDAIAPGHARDRPARRRSRG
jgi:putative transposase